MLISRRLVLFVTDWCLALAHSLDAFGAFRAQTLHRQTASAAAISVATSTTSRFAPRTGLRSALADVATIDDDGVYRNRRCQRWRRRGRVGVMESGSLRRSADDGD